MCHEPQQETDNCAKDGGPVRPRAKWTGFSIASYTGGLLDIESAVLCLNHFLVNDGADGQRETCGADHNRCHADIGTVYHISC